MGVIWTSKTRTRQPQAVVPIDSRFSDKDSFVWTPTFVASGTGPEIPVKGATVTRASNNELMAFATSATDAQRVKGRTGIRFNRTLFVFRFIYTGSTTSFTFGYGDNGVPSFYVEQLDVNMDENGSSSTGKFRFVYRDTAGGNLMCAPTSAVLSAGVVNTLVLGVSSGSTVVGWLNGASLAFNYSSTGASDANAGLPNKEWAILNFNYGSGNSWGGFSGADTNLGASLVARVNTAGFSSARELSVNPWQLFAPEKRPLFFSTGGGANNTGTLAVTLDAATLTGVGGAARSGTLATTLDAATLTGVGNVTRSGTLAVTLDAATLAGTGAVTRSGTLSSTLDAVTLAGVGSVAVGTNRDGVLAVTLDSATLAGTGAVTRSGTLAVTLDAATLAGVGTAGQAITGTLGVTLGNVTLAGIGAIPAAPSAGGGKTFGSNKKKKKQRKAIESEEWLKAEETAKQLLQDRFTKTTPEAKLEALASHIESLQPVIEALKALAREDVQEAVQETRTEELTEHQLVLNRFDALEKKIESVEELLIILMADL